MQHHVGDERLVLFPKVRTIMDADELEALGQEMTSTMAELQKGHPRRDVPLQTAAPMPSVTMPAQSEIGSRVVPHIGRLLALPWSSSAWRSSVGKRVEQARAFATGFVHGVQRGLGARRKREAWPGRGYDLMGGRTLDRVRPHHQRDQRRGGAERRAT